MVFFTLVDGHGLSGQYDTRERQECFGDCRDKIWCRMSPRKGGGDDKDFWCERLQRLDQHLPVERLGWPIGVVNGIGLIEHDLDDRMGALDVFRGILKAIPTVGDKEVEKGVVNSLQSTGILLALYEPSRRREK